jgi:hypothetical protein
MEILKATIFAVGSWLSMMLVGTIWSELQYKRTLHKDQDGKIVSRSILDKINLYLNYDKSE